MGSLISIVLNINKTVLLWKISIFAILLNSIYTDTIIHLNKVKPGLSIFQQVAKQFKHKTDLEKVLLFCTSHWSPSSVAIGKSSQCLWCCRDLAIGDTYSSIRGLLWGRCIGIVTGSRTHNLGFNSSWGCWHNCGLYGSVDITENQYNDYCNSTCYLSF